MVELLLSGDWWFESSHELFLFTVKNIEKTKIKGKETSMAHLKSIM